ncbi:zinc-finger homeodomain protein 3 [Phtheirospermum japonicum]|uniref:Zinc-finger homeodomain protein 3 n=1 Tax=Phtheirospermum japonicum TaxID=374723 RepID=A0A830D0D7_9LAMI|nr:zinc-finger homeodomain protein 3 [Phtheirospermum japonicum]
MANNVTRQQVLVQYTFCQRNHATPHGPLFILDGCGMFEPSGPNESPEAMVCAACRCHRNYHRRVMVDLPPQPHEMTRSPPQPQPAPEAGPSVSQRLTRAQSDTLRAISERNNWRMFREYPKEEVAHICAVLGIKTRCMSDWISRPPVGQVGTSTGRS